MKAFRDFTEDSGLLLCAKSVPSFLYFSVHWQYFAQIPFTSLQFPLYEYLKYRAALYLAPKRQHKQLYAHEAAVCGSIAGGVAAALTTPLDVLKTRVMLDLKVCRCQSCRVSQLNSFLSRVHQLASLHKIFPCWRVFGWYTRQKVSVLFLLESYLGQCGFQLEAQYSWECMSWSWTI